MESLIARPDGRDLTTAAAVACSDLTRRYGSGDGAVHAVRGVTLEIRQGELVAIMGPSGSGKSTLVHMLAGLDRPTSGTVTIGGTEISGLDDDELTILRRERIGFVFQFFNLLPMLSAEQNIRLPLALAGRRADEGVVSELIDRVGLRDRKRHRPAELSGGQQQRVGIARALVTRPAVLVADEPTGNLDSRCGAEILALLRESVTNLRQTTVMVTHDAAAAAIADRVLLLADGRLAGELTRPDHRQILDAIAELGAR